MGNFRRNRGRDSDGFSREGGFSGSRGGGRSFGGRGGGFGGRGGGRSFGGGGFRDRDSRSTEMFDAVCSKCGKNCKVPFKPTGSKPVFCSDCFSKEGAGRHDFAPRQSGGFNSAPSNAGSMPNAEMAKMNAKLDKILEILNNLEIEVEEAEGEDDMEDGDEDEDEEESEDL